MKVYNCYTQGRKYCRIMAVRPEFVEERAFPEAIHGSTSHRERPSKLSAHFLTACLDALTNPNSCLVP